MKRYSIFALGLVSFIAILISCSKLTGGGDGGDDGNSPFVIVDLRVGAFTDSTIQLKWTATGDDSSAGRADHYDIRYMQHLVNWSNWDSATQVSGEPAPSLAGQTDSMTIAGLLMDSTYYFAIMAYDEAGNGSGMSPCAVGTCFTDIVVVFSDLNFETAIRNFIHRPTGDIYRSYLLYTDHRFVADNMDIYNISGLQYCISLDELFLGVNNISDIGPISGMTHLREVQLFANNVSDISPIANLSNLRQILLMDNAVADISPLANHHSLHAVNLAANSITSIPPLAHLDSLEEISLRQNQISDIRNLSSLTSIVSLDLDENNISDSLGGISSLSGLNRLHFLNLIENHITDIYALVANEGLAAGDTIHLEANPLSPLSINTYIPELRSRGVVVFY